MAARSDTSNTLIRDAIREPGAGGPGQYAQRVYQLAAIYGALFAGSLAGEIILLWQGKIFVALAQRTNVETLTLAFLAIFFGYVIVLSRRGALGALRILWWFLRARRSQDRGALERQKMQALQGRPGKVLSVALNLVLEREDQPGQPWNLPVGDAAGCLGVLTVDGARVTFEECCLGGSNNLFAYFVHQVNELLGRRGVRRAVDIVRWHTLDDEATEEYLGLVEFARNLERHLGARGLWQQQVLTERECEVLEQRLSAVCPALRDEAFLPDWEYAGEHKLPVIPEPLGLVSLTRSERRVDPVASMGFAMMVVLAVLGVLLLLVSVPPWVPSA